MWISESLDHVIMNVLLAVQTVGLIIIIMVSLPIAARSQWKQFRWGCAIAVMWLFLIAVNIASRH